MEENEKFIEALNYVDDLNKFLPNLSQEDIAVVYAKISEITAEKDFYRFMEGTGDYPDFFFMPNEITIKQKIYESYNKEPVRNLLKAKYELLDMALKKYEKDNKEIYHQFYLFLRLANHLLTKIIYRCGSAKDIPNLYKIFISNMDYMFLDSSISPDLSLRSILLPVKYLNKNNNTIGYNKDRVVTDDINLLLDFSDSGINEESGLILEIFKILKDEEMNDSAKVKFRELATVYILMIMHLSNKAIAVCHSCKEIYIDNKTLKERSICSECYNDKHGISRELIYKK